MSQGKVVVEFKKANGGNIEVSEEKLLQSQQWFERIINTEFEPLQSVDGEVDNFNDEDHSYDEDQDDKGHETPERGSSPSTFSDVTNRYPGELPQTPAIIIKNTAKFKPYTPPTISDKMRQEMIAKRLSDRKRKVEDELPAPRYLFLHYNNL
uniref:Uncharacterized protein n=1 Tax=Panagrolaimus davidi TaxID=227884 RepID=A0A914QCZ8_9BILA